MNKWIMGLIAVAVIGIIFAASLAIWGISLNNQEVDIRTRIEAKQKDNKNQLANTKAKIIQTGQVSEMEADTIMNTIVKYAQARGGNSGGSLIGMVKEAVPTVNLTTLRNLQNIIESSRNSFAFNQTELLSLAQQHTKLLRTFPGNLLFGLLGRKEIDVTIVTSTEVEEAFRTGKDDNLSVFSKKK